jgi:hypothetical protein
MKKETLEQLLKANGIDPSQVASIFADALNFDSGILKGMKKEQEPQVILTLQENFSEKPWEPKMVKGEFAVFAVHRGQGEVEAGISGAINNPMDFLVILESLKKLKKQVLNEAIKYVDEMLAQGEV